MGLFGEWKIISCEVEAKSAAQRGDWEECLSKAQKGLELCMRDSGFSESFVDHMAELKELECLAEKNLHKY